MTRQELDYPLPPELIAQQPLEPRDAARLLVVDRAANALRDEAVLNLPVYLRAGDLLVVNESFVLPARFWLRRPTGGRLEGLFVQVVDPAGHEWEVLLKGASAVRAGEALAFEPVSAGARAVLRQRLGRGRFIVQVDPPTTPLDLLGRVGTVPLPKYIHRPATGGDVQRYQTVYADPAQAGSVAAPTAGLHFTPRLLSAVEAAGVGLAKVTLHVGPGTFQPITADRLDDHEMHAEFYELGPAAAQAIAEAKQRGGRVIAVGSTALRTLETTGGLAASGWTRLFLRPPARPRVVDALMTNFHLPCSTLLALVMAVAGVDLTRRAYAHAVAQRYRFFSYGDAMLIV